MKSPPEGVITVSKALCWMFDVKPKKVTAEDGRTKVEDYWEPSKKSLWGAPWQRGVGGKEDEVE